MIIQLAKMMNPSITHRYMDVGPRNVKKYKEYCSVKYFDFNCFAFGALSLNRQQRAKTKIAEMVWQLQTMCNQHQRKGSHLV